MSDKIIEVPENELQKTLSDLSAKVRQDTINEIKSLNPFGQQKTETKQRAMGDSLFKSITALYDAKTKSQQVEKSLDELIAKNSNYEHIANELKAVSFTGGEALIPIQYSSEIIPALYNASAFLGKMPRETMVTKQMKMAKELFYPTVYWNAEIDETSRVSNAEFGSVDLDAKAATAMVLIPNDKLKEAAATGRDLDTTIVNSIVRGITQAAEYQILYGPGNNNKPLGIDGKMDAGNKFNSAGTGLANIEADFYKALEKIEGANVSAEMPMYLMSSRSKNYLGSIQNGLTLPAFPEIATGKFKGVDLGVTNTILNTTGNGSQSHIWLIDWSKFILGVFQDMEIFIDVNGSFVDSAGVTRSARQLDVTILSARFKFDFGMFYSKAAAKIEAVSYSL